MDRSELTTEEVLNRDIQWETYVATKLITGSSLQLLRRYEKKSTNHQAALLDDDQNGLLNFNFWNGGHREWKQAYMLTGDGVKTRCCLLLLGTSILSMWMTQPKSTQPYNKPKIKDSGDGKKLGTIRIYYGDRLLLIFKDPRKRVGIGWWLTPCHW